MVALATAYAKRGYVAASIDYRLLGVPGGGCGDPSAEDLEACRIAVLAAQHDAQAAIRFLRANSATYGIDPTRVAIQGGSAGGGTAILVAIHSDDPGNSGTPGQSSAVRAAMPISGGIGPAGRDEIEPFVDPSDAPVLLFYGLSDPGQPVEWPIATAELLGDQGGGGFTQALQGGHVPGDPGSRSIEIDQSSFFMWWMLDLANAQGQPLPVARASARRLDELSESDPELARQIREIQARGAGD